jgi:hypothetical protein
MTSLPVVFDELVSVAEGGLLTPGPDVLAAYSPDVVAGWYERLALATQDWFSKSKPGGGQSLSAEFLHYWEDSSRKVTDASGKVIWNNVAKEFDAAVMAGNGPLRAVLASEVRPVFLSERQRGHDSNKGYGGAVRRLQQGWDGKPLALTYEAGNIEGATNADKAKLIYQLQFSHPEPEEIDWPNLDIYASLHTFAVESTAVIRATPVAGDAKRFTIDFDSWTWKVTDTYDWDPSKRNDMPNPDFKKAPGPFVVAPDLRYITVWHRNAKRVEAAGFAAPFPVKSTVHVETDPELLKSAVVRVDRNLGP